MFRERRRDACRVHGAGRASFERVLKGAAGGGRRAGLGTVTVSTRRHRRDSSAASVASGSGTPPWRI